jgi:hypothetical protein
VRGGAWRCKAKLRGYRMWGGGWGGVCVGGCGCVCVCVCVCALSRAWSCLPRTRSFSPAARLPLFRGEKSAYELQSRKCSWRDGTQHRQHQQLQQPHSTTKATAMKSAHVANASQCNYCSYCSQYSQHSTCDSIVLHLHSSWVVAPPSHAPSLGMDLTAWFGPQGVFSSGDAAHIFGSGSVVRLATTTEGTQCGRYAPNTRPTG